MHHCSTENINQPNHSLILIAETPKRKKKIRVINRNQKQSKVLKI